MDFINNLKEVDINLIKTHCELNPRQTANERTKNFSQSTKHRG